MTEHQHKYEPLYAAVLSHEQYPNFIVYYHCSVDNCDSGTCEVEDCYEL